MSTDVRALLPLHFYENTGKTVFLWYLLRHRLSLRLPTVFAIGDSCFFFHQTGAYIASATAPFAFLLEDATTSSSELVWALIDRMNQKTEPPPWLVTSDLFPVQSAPPNASQYKAWMKVPSFLSNVSERLSQISDRKKWPNSTS